ncbi:MAG: PilZ domain-containing protein [Candidatus Acidiferrales bacterium]
MPSTSETLVSVSRSFVYSLNALLKFARLYGLHHARSATQFQDTWKELKAAIEAAGPAGFMVGTSGSKLVLDGAVLESTAAENSLAQIFTNAGIASIAFTPEVSEDSFGDFVRAFAGAGVKPSNLRTFLKNSTGESSQRGIRINELRFVPASNGASDAAQNWLRDPAKLAEMIGAEEASRRVRRFKSFEFGEELVGTAHWDGQDAADRLLTGEEINELMNVVTTTTAASEEGTSNGAEWKERFDVLPANAKSVFREAFAEVILKLRPSTLDNSAWYRLSTDVAIRCATERFESGAINASAVRPLLDKLGKEIEVGTRASLAEQGIAADSLTDVLYRQFWASVSEDRKQNVLLSPECWRVPARNIQQYVKEQQRRGDTAAAEKILMQYARGVCHLDPDARRETANGMMQIADIYTRAGGAPLDEAVRAIGEQLSRERDAELQSLLSAAFVKFSQEAAEQSEFPAVRRALDTLTVLEKSRPSWTRSLGPRIGIHNRIPEFIEEGLKDSAPRPELVEVLRRAPDAAAAQLASRLMRVTRGSERENVVAMARAIGEPVKVQLRQTLELAPVGSAVRVVGLLSRVEPIVVEELLPRRIRSGERSAHDEALRQLSIAGAPERGRTLMRMMESLDAMIVPMALDEIGMCGDVTVAPDVLRVAKGESLPDSSDFLRVKAIEALGRLRAPGMEGDLLRFVEAKGAWRWTYPHEMRLAAAQALVKIDPERAPALLASSGLNARLLGLAPLDAKRDHDFVRYRRYERIRMIRPMPAVIQSQRGKYQPAVQVLSLEGGLLSGNVQLSVGTPARLCISSGMRPIRLDVLVRFVKSNQAGVETVGMELEDRSRLRNLLLSMTGASEPNQPLPVPA